MKNDTILRMEKITVEKLRSEGFKLKDIAERMSRSIYWVHSRLNGKYEPNRTRIEKHFQDSIVIERLKEGGHNILFGNTRTRCREFNQEVDVMSVKDGKIYITEVKNLVNHHQLQTAIGQIVLHQFGRKDVDYNVYQIVFPERYRDHSFFSISLLKYLRDEMKIDIVFM